MSSCNSSDVPLPRQGEKNGLQQSGTVPTNATKTASDILLILTVLECTAALFAKSNVSGFRQW